MKYRHFGKANQKRSLLRGLALSVLKNGGINTLETRAKETQKFLEQIIREAKKDTVAGRRKISSLLSTDRDTVSHIYEKILPNFSGRTSGFTRIIRLGQRKGDGTSMARVEWVVLPKAQKVEQVEKTEDVEQVEKEGTRSTKGTKSTKKKKESVAK